MFQLCSAVLLLFVETCLPTTYHKAMKTGTEHRKQLSRYDIPWHAHELTFSCYHERPFLLKERVRIWLAEAVKMGLEKHSMDLWAYVFMPEHSRNTVARTLLRPFQTLYNHDGCVSGGCQVYVGIFLSIYRSNIPICRSNVKSGSLAPRMVQE